MNPRPILKRFALAAWIRAAFVFLLASSAVLIPLVAQQPADEVRITILGTTDIHGNIWPYDYLRGAPTQRGLAMAATYVKQVRVEAPNVLLVDVGDTFQGTPLAYYSAMKFDDLPNPVAAAMNAMGYDAMATGNHEFNFGLEPLWHIREQLKFPVLGANILSSYHDPRRDYERYVIKEVAGVKVALLGLVTPAVPKWDPPGHVRGYEFRDPVEVAKKLVPKLRKKVDVVVVLIHSGLGADAETGERDFGYDLENRTYALASEVPGIDVIFFGHSHRVLEGAFVGDALLIQPKNWVQQVARVDLILERDGKRWKLTTRSATLAAIHPRYAEGAVDMSHLEPDPEILELTREAHERTERELKTVIARLDSDLSGREGRIYDHPLVEIINRAQLDASGADVSLAALFGTFTNWKKGPLTMRDVYSLYYYENRLFVAEITGQDLRDALEHVAATYKTFPWDEGEWPISGSTYNLDFAQGVSYQMDLSRAPGDRIVGLSRNGKPLDPSAKLTVAMNSYRWAGGGDFKTLRHAKIVKRFKQQVREIVAEYLRKQGIVDTSVDNNWSIVPPEARQALIRTANR